MTVLTSTASVQFDPGGPAEVAATVRLNGGSRIYCHTYADSAPILSVVDEHVRMSVSVPDPDQVTPDDVTWGRLLAEAVAKYVAELERRVPLAREDSSGRAA